MAKLSSRQRAQNAVTAFRNRFQPKQITHRALVGDGAGHVIAVSGKHIYWVRILGRQQMIVGAVCYDFVPAHGMWVIVEEEQRQGQALYRILRRATDEDWGEQHFDGWHTDSRGGGSPAPEHSSAHEYGGADMINVNKWMVEPLRATPGGTDNPLQVYVSYDQSLMFGTDVVDFPGGGEAGEFSPVFVAPSWGQRYDLLSVDKDGDLNVTQGTVAWVDPVRPPCPTGEIPISYVFLTKTTTQITTGNIVDARPLFTVGPTGAVGPTGETGDTGPYGGDHVHIFAEDHTYEVDGAKTTFHTANEFEPYSLQVFHQGHILRSKEMDPNLYDYEELDTHDGFTLAITTGVGDTLICSYLTAFMWE